MTNSPADNPRAAKCRELAAKATDERTRRYWLAMAQVWLFREINKVQTPSETVEH